MTLIELLVVLAIMGLVLGVSVPALIGYSQQIRLKTVTREVMGLVSLARQQAISSQEEHAVVVDQTQHEVTLVTLSSGEVHERRVKLPSSILIDVQVDGQPAPESQLIFRPAGSLTGQTTSLLLANDEKQYTITVTAATGAVSVQ